MGKQIKVYDLLSKKQSLDVFKNQKKKNQLLEELNAARAYKEQLIEISTSILNDNTEKTVSQIKSESWYSLKIQDELLAIESKIEFLIVEIKDHGIQIAIASEKKRKFDEKKLQLKKIATRDKENRQEMLATRSSANQSKY